MEGEEALGPIHHLGGRGKNGTGAPGAPRPETRRTCTARGERRARAARGGVLGGRCGRLWWGAVDRLCLVQGSQRPWGWPYRMEWGARRARRARGDGLPWGALVTCCTWAPSKWTSPSMSSTNARHRCAAGTCGAGSERGNGTVSASELAAACGDRVLTNGISLGGVPHTTPHMRSAKVGDRVLDPRRAAAVLSAAACGAPARDT